MNTQIPTGYNAPAYLIRRGDDPVLAQLTDDEAAAMCIGRMPCRNIDGWYRCISIGNDELLAKLRLKYFYVEKNVYHRRK